MIQHLLPVWGYSRFSAAARDIGLPGAEKKDAGARGEAVGWFDGPPMHYPHALISPVHWQKPFHFPASAYIFGDSGGFSLASKTMSDKLKVDPVGVLRWQESLCTVGCILDRPPVGLRPDQRIWEQGKRETIEHTIRALPVYKEMLQRGTKFRWWGILHGSNVAEIREYYAAIAAVYPFDQPGEGWAIRPEPRVDIDASTRSLRVLKQLGITRAHFLAATSQDVIAVLLALGPQAGLEMLTYDSAYAVKSGFNRHVFRPNDDGLTFSIMTEVGESRESRDWLLNKCPCPVCAHMRVRSEQEPRAHAQLHSKVFGGWWSSWLQFHDLYVQQDLTQRQAEYAEKNPEGLLRKMLSVTDYSRIMRVFEADGHEKNSIVRTGSSQSLLDFI